MSTRVKKAHNPEYPYHNIIGTKNPNNTSVAHEETYKEIFPDRREEGSKLKQSKLKASWYHFYQI